MKKSLIIIIVILIAVVLFLGDPGGSSDDKSKFITANPLDLTQIKAISKFRSCEGHDYSGKNIDGESETNRSMKHYVEAVDSLAHTTNQVKALAPFDGKIGSIEIDENPRGVQVWLSPENGGNWKFVFFHIDLLPNVTKGTEVKAGELIGYADLADAANFDIALKVIGFSQKFDSVFDHMEDSVMQQYQDAGLTAENIVVTKDTRDADPCDFGQGSDMDGWIIINNANTAIEVVNTNTTNTNTSTIDNTGFIRWNNRDDSFVPTGTPPECPDPLVMQTPVDLTRVINILYPGQKRGGDFKAHGGFRFEGVAGLEVPVTIPMDAWLIEGARYIEGGHLQYMFGFQNSCGIMYRFDHLYTLTDKLQERADALPEPKEDDTRTYYFPKVIEFTAGEIIATAVGAGDNVFVDWGVYDIRQKNGVTTDEPEDTLAEYGVCWFDLLNAEDEATVRSLPAGDSISGANSEYCL